MRTLDVWYASIDMEKLIPTIQDEEARKLAQKRLAKARKRSVLEYDFPELVHQDGLAPTIKESPPLIYHWREKGHEELMAMYKRTSPITGKAAGTPRPLLHRFKLIDIAIKVVGIGCVGTMRGVILLMASETDPLYLQLKEARQSVLEAYAEKRPRQPRPTHRDRLQADAIGKRSLSGPDTRGTRPAFLHSPAQGREDQDTRRDLYTERHAAICRDMAGVWPAPMPAPVNPRKSAATWARVMP
jgi:hypothetical protein